MTSPHACARRPPNDEGFTLVEMLIILVISVLVLALTPNLLRTSSRVQTLVTHLDHRMTQTATLTALMARIEAARPIYEVQPNGLSKLVFQGDNNRLRFVSAFESGPSGGGLYLVDFGAVGHPESASFATAMTLYAYPVSAMDGPIEQRPIAGGHSTPQFRYFGFDPETGAQRWHESWTERNQLPHLIELTMSNPDSADAGQHVQLISLALKR